MCASFGNAQVCLTYACLRSHDGSPFVPLLFDRPMLTDYFSTERFLDALDYYAHVMPIDKLGVGMMNRQDISSDGYAARFHAIKASGAKELDMFILRKLVSFSLLA